MDPMNLFNDIQLPTSSNYSNAQSSFIASDQEGVKINDVLSALFVAFLLVLTLTILYFSIGHTKWRFLTSHFSKETNVVKIKMNVPVKVSLK